MKRRPVQYAGLNAHRMVATLAIEMAQQLFEVYARENAFYRKMRANGQVTEKAARKLFVERVAPRMLEDARMALVDMMAAPTTTEYVKNEIYEALCLDSDLRANRFVAADVATVPPSLH